MLRELRLHGELASIVGADCLHLDVASPAEAVRALVFQFPKTRPVIRDSAWQVIDAGFEIGNEDAIALYGQGATGPIELIPVLEGAGDAGGPLKLVFGILLLGAAFLTGGVTGIFAGFGTGGVLGLAGPLGIVLALSGISQLVAPQPNQNYMAPEDAEDRQDFLFSGSSNLRSSGHPIPLAYGEMRIGSVTVSELVRVRDVLREDNRLESESYLQIVDVISEGPIEGLVNGAQSIILDGVQVEAASGGTNFEDFEYTLKVGASGDDALANVVGRTIPVGLQPTNTTGNEAERVSEAVERVITDANVDNCAVVLRWQALFDVNDTTGDPESTSVEAKIEIDANGGGFTDAAFRGTVDVWEDLNTATTEQTLDPTDVVSIEWFLRNAYWGSDPGSSVDCYLQTQPTGSSGWTTQKTIPIEVAEDTITGSVWTPGGVHLYTMLFDPNFRVFVEEFTEFLTSDQYDVRFSFSTAADGHNGAARAWSQSIVINGVAEQPYEKEFVLNNLAGYGSAPWTIRVSRVTQDSSDPTDVVDAFVWDRYTEEIEDTFLHDGVAEIAISATAKQLSGRIPQRQYDTRNRLLKLPSDLTTSTRTYSGSPWDGTFKGSEEWYDNPVWILYDLLKNTDYGLGIPESAIDKWSFYDAAVWCDEFVDDGEGGTEPRFTFNHQFTTREDAWRDITVIAASFQGQLWEGQGKVFLVVDKPGSVARIFGPSNVKGGAFEYTGLAKSARFTVAKVSYREPDLGYANEVELIDRPFGIDRFGRQEMDIVAIGCTSRGQAMRRARYDVLTAELEPGTVKFTVGPMDALLEVGEIVLVHDRWRERVEWAGRVTAIDTMNVRITFDRTHGITPGTPPGYTARVMLSDGTLHSSVVAEVGTDWVDLSTTWVPGDIEIGAVVLLTKSNERYYRVFGIDEVGKDEYEVTALEHDPDKQDQVEDFADIGSEIALPAAVVLSAPNITATAARYHEPDDSWYGDVTVETLDLDVGWVLVDYDIVVPPPTANFKRRKKIDPHLTTSVVVTQRLGLHDDIKTESFLITVTMETPDGSVVSTSDTDAINIPASRP